MSYCVYMHINKVNGKRYVGITSKRPEYRWSNGNGYQQNRHFRNAINKYGWDNFEHIVLAYDISQNLACELERALIAQFESNKQEKGYNNSEGGEKPALGSKQTEEAIEKRRKHLIGKKRPEVGKKISDAKRGNPNGLEGRTGKKCPKAGIVYQINEKTHKVVSTYYGYDEMRRMTGYAKTPIRETIEGKRKRAYGYLWKYEKRGVKSVSV